MKRFLIFAVVFSFAAISLCASSDVASAALTPTASASPAPYSGSCPVTINFSGKLYALAAGTLKYYFLYHDPGQNKNISNATKSVTAKMAGPVDVSDVGSMTGSGAGSVTLFEVSPNAGQSLPFAIAVTCAGSSNVTVRAPQPNPNLHLVTPKPWAHAPAPTQIFHWKSVPFITSDFRLNQYKNGAAVVGGLPENGLSCGGNLCAGFAHVTTGGGPPFGYHEIDDWRSYMQFAKFPGPVNQALLTLTTNDPQDVKCLEGVAPALGVWQGNKLWVNGDFNYPAPLQVSGNTFTFDVTSIAQAWVSAKLENYGFVIAGSDESGSGPDNISCTINFAVPPVLQVR